MKNTIIMLYGHPAAGKFTIAKEIAALTEAKVVDNHLINNPIFQLVRTDGKGDLPEAVWDYTVRIRAVVYDAILNLAEPKTSFIFTGVLYQDIVTDRAAMPKLENLAKARNAVFVPVCVECQLETLISRVSAAEREFHMKMTSPDGLQELYERHELLHYQHPNLLVLDNSTKTASESANIIIMHAKKLTQ